MKAKRSLAHIGTWREPAVRAGAHRRPASRILPVRAVRAIAVLALALGGLATTALTLPQHGATQARVAVHQPAVRHVSSPQLAVTPQLHRPWMY